MPDEIKQSAPTTNMEVQPAEGQAADAPATPSTAPVATKVRGQKKKKFFLHGQAHIHATYNNTIVTITDDQGNVLGWSSAGKCGFKGPKKATPYAAGIIVRDVIEKTKTIGLKSVDVYVRGVGLGREAAIRALAGAGLTISSIKDQTPVPHNGPRAPKPRRV